MRAARRSTLARSCVKRSGKYSPFGSTSSGSPAGMRSPCTSSAYVSASRRKVVSGSASTHKASQKRAADATLATAAAENGRPLLHVHPADHAPSRVQTKAAAPGLRPDGGFVFELTQAVGIAGRVARTGIADFYPHAQSLRARPHFFRVEREASREEQQTRVLEQVLEDG